MYKRIKREKKRNIHCPNGRYPIVTHRGLMGKINFDIIKIAKNTFLSIPFMRH